MINLHEVNKIVCKLNELEDSKEGQSIEKRVELSDRMILLYKELHAKIGEIICTF